MHVQSTAIMTDQASLLSSLHDRAASARSWLFASALPLWWERGFDRASQTFCERIRQDGSPDLDAPRRSRVQARQASVFAIAGDLGWDGPWREAVEAGARAVVDRCLRNDGGVNHMLGPDGRAVDNRRDLYNTAFAIFGLAHAGRALKKTAHIAEAERLVNWLEQTWALPQGGFQEGDVAHAPPRRQNPHMHLFEAFLALHAATNNPAHLARANAIANLFDSMLYDAASGTLPEYFGDAWQPLAGDKGRIREPGHHFEWTWLLEQNRLTGGKDMSAAAKRLLAFGEQHGVDAASGLIFDEVDTDGAPLKRVSRLWPHTERIKGNLAVWRRTNDNHALARALAAYDVLSMYLDTPVAGLWRDRREVGGDFVDEPAPASSFYHIILALKELIGASETARS
jgi:mannose/cellobiose epimerase-like protein (N-acyl-D-glucosamine 2-epimerase family)